MIHTPSSVALLASLPLLLLPATKSFASSVDSVCAGYYSTLAGTAKECLNSTYLGTPPDAGVNINSQYAQYTGGNMSATAKVYVAPTPQVSVSANAVTAANLPYGETATASAIGQYLDSLTFQHVTILNSGTNVTTNPLFLLPGSVIQITETLTTEMQGSAIAQTAIDFGNPGDINSVIGNLDPNSGLFTFQSGNTPAGNKSSFTDIGTPFSNILQYDIQDANYSAGPMNAIRFALTDAVNVAGNGSASITDPISFTIFDPNGNIIPDIVITAASGFNYTVTDGYVPDNSGPGSGGNPVPTPEPSSLLLLATGIPGLLAAVSRTAKRHHQPRV